jgi:hypothetical protein
MKKVMMMLVAVAAIAFASCKGEEKPADAAADSAVACADSCGAAVAVEVADSADVAE